MLNRKRIAAVIAATALTVTVQSAVGLSLTEKNGYGPVIKASASEVSNEVIAEISKTEKESDGQEIVTDDNIMILEEDPGQERLSGEIILPDFEEILEEAMMAAQGRAISAFSPFMGNTPYFHSDVFAGRRIAHGIDVSKYQKDIDWKAVKEAGVEYAIIRVGFRGYGKTGGIGADTYFEKNIKGALEAGIEVGVYFFSQATTVEEAKEEAQYALDKIKDYNITLPVVMDFEYASVNGKEGGRLYDANLSKAVATNVCLAFCETVENAGYEPMVYANSSMLKNKLNASDISSKYKIWLANYTSMTAYTGEYDFWQYSSKGTVDGITGNVDCNFWYQESPFIVPEIVTGFSVGGRTETRIRLNWNLVEGATGYRIYRYDETEKIYKKVKTVTNGATATWVDTTVQPGKSYNYVIKSYIKDDVNTWWSVKSEAVVAKTRTEAVEGFAVTISRKDKLRLSWKPVEGAAGYRIYRYNSKTKSYERIRTLGSGDITTWVNSNLKSNTTYKYKITAYMEDEAGTRYSSVYSEVVTGKTKK